MRINDDDEMRTILQSMLENDEDITGRGVIRYHSTIKAVSTIFRSKTRYTMLLDFQERQKHLRAWKVRTSKKSTQSISGELAKKDLYIAELEGKIQLLESAHLRMIRIVAEYGGVSRLLAFYEQNQAAKSALSKLSEF